ncbi:MAG: hypothetical protein WCO48_01790 [Candidatus Taylorbacteria bacterium]
MKNKIIIIGLAFLVLSSVNVSAQTIAPNANENPSQTDFKLVNCDGPALPTNGTVKSEFLKTWSAQTGKVPGDYKACDFNGALAQVQHLMNIAIILGVLAAILLFSFAGFKLVSASFTGKVADVDRAKDIFQKVAIGFIIMLVAWFVVYQIISWLSGGSSAGTALLSK